MVFGICIARYTQEKSLLSREKVRRANWGLCLEKSACARLSPRALSSVRVRVTLDPLLHLYACFSMGFLQAFQSD